MTPYRANIDAQLAARPIEARLLKKIRAALASNGTPIINIFDGEEWSPVTSLRDLYVSAFDLDELILETTDGAQVWLVMGEDVADVISNYSMSLETALAPVYTWAER